jgi:hypothetical protein
VQVQQRRDGGGGGGSGSGSRYGGSYSGSGKGGKGGGGGYGKGKGGKGGYGGRGGGREGGDDFDGGAAAELRPGAPSKDFGHEATCSMAEATRRLGGSPREVHQTGSSGRYITLSCVFRSLCVDALVFALRADRFIGRARVRVRYVRVSFFCVPIKRCAATFTSSKAKAF